MIREPKMLTWLANEAGVPVPVASAIWQDVVRQSTTASNGKVGADTARRQVRQLRRRLKDWVAPQHKPEHGGGWALLMPACGAWVNCQAQLFRNAWMAWVHAGRMARTASLQDLGMIPFDQPSEIREFRTANRGSSVVLHSAWNLSGGCWRE